MNKWIKLTTLISSGVILASAGTGMISAASYQTINWTEISDLQTLDPSLATDSTSITALSSSTVGLYATKDGQPVLDAAKSVKKSADGLKYTVTLRPNLKWSDGSKLTANDFVYGWQRTNDPKTASEYAYLMSGVKNADAIQKGEVTNLDELGIKAVNDTTLEIELERPLAVFEALLTMPAFFPQSKAFEEKVGSKYGTTANDFLSSGPYIVKDWNGSNQKYSFVKNPDYWDAKAVKTPKITTQIIKDQNTGYNLFKGGKVDFTRLSPDQVKASKSSKEYGVSSLGASNALTLNEVKVPEFKNIKLRQAISSAIDRKTLAEKIMNGSAVAATTITPTHFAKAANGKDFATDSVSKGAISYDAKKAAKLWSQGLKEVGKKNLSFTILTDDDDASKRAVQFVQSELEDHLKGLKVEIKTVPKKQRLALQTAKNFDVVVFTWMADYSDPSSFLDLYTTNATYNYGGWSNSAYDTAVKKAQTVDAANAKARLKDYAVAEKIIEQKLGSIPLYYRATPYLKNQKIKKLVLNAAGNPVEFKYAYKK
ncbi:peptide ABC transporter substrate-binding protein [Weissella diestrammenae]|uniref:Peptide ABC transporter substrate-binding protein n=1 Tax=Weissella diestrammenae TaxID=1162633 RepID=A0A7G9T6G8_9LACO|nr:peptide ABC transporter substrate-binding protein [Weissella diestrammenae]MCM0583253.1 peptide ABC transporter substrate-binding protein [Weissella diestrammenae]QNN75693.1 peptide ABC transporter substrate-binding protein [Weissella diestrammenae]